MARSLKSVGLATIESQTFERNQAKDTVKNPAVGNKYTIEI